MLKIILIQYIIKMKEMNIMEENYRKMVVEMMKRHMDPGDILKIREPLMDSQEKMKKMTIGLQNNKDATLEQIYEQVKIIKEEN